MSELTGILRIFAGNQCLSFQFGCDPGALRLCLKLANSGCDAIKFIRSHFNTCTHCFLDIRLAFKFQS